MYKATKQFDAESIISKPGVIAVASSFGNILTSGNKFSELNCLDYVFEMIEPNLNSLNKYACSSMTSKIDKLTIRYRAAVLDFCTLETIAIVSESENSFYKSAERLIRNSWGVKDISVMDRDQINNAYLTKSLVLWEDAPTSKYISPNSKWGFMSGVDASVQNFIGVPECNKIYFKSILTRETFGPLSADDWARMNLKS